MQSVWTRRSTAVLNAVASLNVNCSVAFIVLPAAPNVVQVVAVVVCFTYALFNVLTILYIRTAKHMYVLFVYASRAVQLMATCWELPML